MRILPVENVESGMKIGKAVYNSNGALMLGRGTILSDMVVSKLNQHNISFLYIDDELSAGIEPSNTIDEEIKVKIITKFKKTIDAKQAFSRPETMKNCMNLVQELIDNIQKSDAKSYYVMELMGTDMYTYYHSVNVAIISILVGIKLKMQHSELFNLGMGALLHDIGKVNIPPEILQKPIGLSDEELRIIQTHPLEGYNMIKGEYHMHGMVKNIIMNHHEKLDGSGYPRGLTAKDTPLPVRIVTMADMFDALTSNRVYKQAYPVYKALEILMTDSVYKLDKSIYQPFVESINIFPEGSLVVLTGDIMGMVIAQNPVNPSRPVVKNLKDDSVIDLSKKLSLFIEKVY